MTLFFPALPCYVYLTLNTDIRGKATKIWRSSIGEVVSPRAQRLIKRSHDDYPGRGDSSSTPLQKESPNTITHLYMSEDSFGDEVFL